MNMEKIERLIAIVMILLQKDIVSTTEFAKWFHVSKRTILRDMETLSMSNVPIYAISGVHGGYGIMEEYKLDKRLLSNQDLENILTALSGLEQLLFSSEVEVTVKKIESMVNASARKGSVHLSFYDWDGRSEILRILKTCQEAILQQRLLTFDYIDKNGVRSQRTVEPYQLHFSEMSWYLKGYCLDRGGNRTFKLSRTEHLVMDRRTFVPRDNSPEQQAEESYHPLLVEVKALISPAIKDQFVERYGSRSVESSDHDTLIATIHLPQNHYGFQFLAGFGSNLEILEPNAYVDDFREFLKNIMAKYS